MRWIIIYSAGVLIGWGYTGYCYYRSLVNEKISNDVFDAFFLSVIWPGAAIVALCYSPFAIAKRGIAALAARQRRKHFVESEKLPLVSPVEEAERMAEALIAKDER